MKIWEDEAQSLLLYNSEGCAGSFEIWMLFKEKKKMNTSPVRMYSLWS